MLTKCVFLRFFIIIVGTETLYVFDTAFCSSTVQASSNDERAVGPCSCVSSIYLLGKKVVTRAYFISNHLPVCYNSYPLKLSQNNNHENSPNP